MTSAAAGGRPTTPVYDPNTRLFARHTPLAAHSPMCRPAGRPSGSSRPPPGETSAAWWRPDRGGGRKQTVSFRLWPESASRHPATHGDVAYVTFNGTFQILSLLAPGWGRRAAGRVRDGLEARIGGRRATLANAHSSCEEILYPVRL